MDKELIKLEQLKLNWFKYRMIYFNLCLEQKCNEFNYEYLIEHIL